MRETEKRIKKYTARLPKVRERVMSALVLFLVAASMLIVSTFSWVTLSFAPEVKGISTTIAANGNLEIALAGSGDVPPAESAIGDGSLSLVARNLTWGNLINLSDPSYGLDKIILRPAALNQSDMSVSPIYAIAYTADGRAIPMESAEKPFDLTYAVYDINEGKRFKTLSENVTSKGVKAIAVAEEATDVSYDDPNMATYIALLDQAKSNYNTASDSFIKLGAQLSSVAGLMGTYMEAVLATGTIDGVYVNGYQTTACNNNDLKAFYNLMCQMYDDVMIPMARSYQSMMEAYQFKTKAENNSYPYQTYNNSPTTSFPSLEAFVAKNENGQYAAIVELDRMNTYRGENPVTLEMFNNNSDIQSFSPKKAQSSFLTFLKDMEAVDGYIADFEEKYLPKINAGGQIMWSELDTMINAFIHIDTCMLDGKSVTHYATSVSEAVSLVTGGGTHEAVVYRGIIKRLDALLYAGKSGVRANGVSVGIKKSAVVTALKIRNKYDTKMQLALGILPSTITVSTNISTAGPIEYSNGSLASLDLKRVSEAVALQLKVFGEFASDTYGFAVDFWVRTNAPSSYLILEGDPIVEETQLYKEIDGVEYQVFVISKKTVYTPNDGSEPTESIQEGLEAYKKDGTWYFLSSSENIEVVDREVYDAEMNVIGKETVTVVENSERPVMEKKVVGYSGANRIWQELDPDAEYPERNDLTTQGMGSCYTFYADSPEDMDRALDIIGAMKITFVDENYTYLATAYMDVENAYKDVGRVTVPLVVEATASNTTIDADGNVINYITSLEKNEPTFISAIVYLDGTLISNENVLAADNIQGQLNLQFGSSKAPLESLENEDLMAESRKVTASVVTGSVTDEEIAQGIFPTSTVTVSVEGTTASKVEAQFTRMINDTQGSREEMITFTQSGNDFVGSYTFNSPGTYLLRSVIVDGVPYQLAEPPQVIINGFRINYISGETASEYLTSNQSVSETFTIEVGALAGTYPKSLVGIFSDGNSSIYTTYNSADGGATWTGTVVFPHSGTFTMEYVMVDDRYENVPTVKTREVHTNLMVNVSISPNEADYVEGGTGGTPFLPKEELAYTKSGIQYKFFCYEHLDAGYDYHEFNVSVEIVDSAGEEISGYSNITLNYARGGDSRPALSPLLRWNGESGKYEGTFQIDGPGSYAFLNAKIGSDMTITKVGSAPRVTVFATEPFTYLGTRTYDNYVNNLAGNNPAQIQLMFDKNAASASVYGLFLYKESENATTSEYRIVKARYSSDTTGEEQSIFSFQLSDKLAQASNLSDANNNAGGYWELLSVHLTNVYDGTDFYSGEEIIESGMTMKKATPMIDPDTKNVLLNEDGIPMVEEFDAADVVESKSYYYLNNYAADTADAWTADIKVLDDLVVTLGNYTTKYDNAFLEAKTIDKFSMVIKDFEGKTTDRNGNKIVTDVKVVVEHQDETMGYTISDLSTYNNSDENGFELDLTETTTGTFAHSETKQLVHRGTYTVNFQYKIFDSDVTKGSNNIVLNTTLPTVKITAISPAKDSSISVDEVTNGKIANDTRTKNSMFSATYSTNGAHKSAGTYTPTFSANEATVYYQCSHRDDASYSVTAVFYVSAPEFHNYSQPTVTLSLSGIGTGMTAKMAFKDSNGAAARLYNSNKGTTQSDFTWTGNTGCTLWVGTFTSGTATNDSKVTAGTVTSKTLDVTDTNSGLVYTFTVPQLTIKNPY